MSVTVESSSRVAVVASVMNDVSTLIKSSVLVTEDSWRIVVEKSIVSVIKEVCKEKDSAVSVMVDSSLIRIVEKCSTSVITTACVETDPEISVVNISVKVVVTSSVSVTKAV